MIQQQGGYVENSPKQTLSIEDQLKLEREIVRVMETMIKSVPDLDQSQIDLHAREALARVAELRGK